MHDADADGADVDTGRPDHAAVPPAGLRGADRSRRTRACARHRPAPWPRGSAPAAAACDGPTAHTSAGAPTAASATLDRPPQLPPRDEAARAAEAAELECTARGTARQQPALAP